MLISDTLQLALAPKWMVRASRSGKKMAVFTAVFVLTVIYICMSLTGSSEENYRVQGGSQSGQCKLVTESSLFITET